jgi:hypothetical protein
MKLLLARITMETARLSPSSSNDREDKLATSTSILQEVVDGLENAYPFSPLLGEVYLFMSCSLALMVSQQIHLYVITIASYHFALS